jgi:hypothetical protein
VWFTNEVTRANLPRRVLIFTPAGRDVRSAAPKPAPKKLVAALGRGLAVCNCLASLHSFPQATDKRAVKHWVSSRPFCAAPLPPLNRMRQRNEQQFGLPRESHTARLSLPISAHPSRFLLFCARGYMLCQAPSQRQLRCPTTHSNVLLEVSSLSDRCRSQPDPSVELNHRIVGIS